MGAFAMSVSALQNVSATCRIYTVNTRKLTAQEWKRSLEWCFDECVCVCVCASLFTLI